MFAKSVLSGFLLFSLIVTQKTYADIGGEPSEAEAAAKSASTASPPFLSVCERTPIIRNVIVTQLQIPCEQITAEDLKRIVKMDLSHRGLDKLRVGDFDGLKNLGELNLSHNRLSTLHLGNIFFPESVHTLHLQHNFLENGINDEVMERLPELQMLNISDNQMKSLPDLRNNAKLMHFYANRNPFAVFPEDTFRANTRLGSVGLSNVGLEGGLPDNFFAGLHLLERIDLSFNKLERFFGHRLFLELPSLEALDLSYNKLPYMPTKLSYLPRLRNLNLEGNNIIFLSDDVALPPSLTWLDLSKNPLQWARPRWLRSFQGKRDTRLYLPSRCGGLLRSLFSR